MSTRASNLSLLPSFPALSLADRWLLIDSLVDYAIFLLDVDGRVVTWNLGAEKIKGYSAQEILGQHFSKFYPPEDVEAGKPARRLELAAEVGRVEDEGWRIRKDGSRFWASVVITALRDESGNLRGFGKVTRDLTERRRADEALRRSEERLRLLIENAGDYAIYMLDPSGRVSSWNLGAERTKGYSADEIIGKNFSIFFPEEDVVAGKPARELARALAEGHFEDEGWRIRKDGSRFWANAVLTTVRDREGHLVGFVKITRDLTASREAQAVEQRLMLERTAREVAEKGERRLRESEERYRAVSQRLEIVLEGVADGITVQDRSMRVVFANSAAATICGFSSPEELVNTPPEVIVQKFEILDEYDRPFAPHRLPGRRALAGEQAPSAMLHVRQHATGRDWWTLVRASAVLGIDGTPELAVNIWHDVSEDHRQERQTKFLDEATAAFGESLQHDEILSTLAGVLVPRLADWCTIFLLESDELRSVAAAHADPGRAESLSAFQDEYPPDPTGQRGAWNVVRTGRSELYADVSDDLLVAGSRSPEHLRLLRAIGVRSGLLVPIRLRGEVLGVIRLVSIRSELRYDEHSVALVEELGRRAGVAIENARLYRHAQESAKVAEQANRAKDEFLAMVSHELRTPLNAILGWSTLLKDRVTDPVVVKPIDVIHRNAQRQVRLIDDIMDVSRIVTGNFKVDPKPADLVRVTREAIEVVRHAAISKRIRIEFTPLEDFVLLVVDPERLQQVIWNLLSNAVKFTDEGGEIHISLWQEGADVSLSVKDTGKGIDPEFLPMVFDRFKQGDTSITRRTGGLGLGLALVRHIVELHGGRVTALSEGVGKGATFTLTLPIRAVIPRTTESSRPPPAEPSATRVPRPLQGVRVLIVDDEQDARDLISAVLAEAGAEVRVARSAAEGFESMKQAPVDVLVSDVAMPDEDGFSFMRRIRGLPDTEGGLVPSVALTAFARDEERSRAISAGYTTHLGKPVDPTELIAAVANLAIVTRRRNARSS